MTLQQSTAVPVVSTSMEEFEYNWLDLFDLTGSRVSFFPALLTSGPSNSCGKKNVDLILFIYLYLYMDKISGLKVITKILVITSLRY